MLKSDLTIKDYAQRGRVLGRRADTRLARALRHTVPLHRRILGFLMRSLRARAALIRPHMIRQWQNGSFVEKIITPAATA